MLNENEHGGDSIHTQHSPSHKAKNYRTIYSSPFPYREKSQFVLGTPEELGMGLGEILDQIRQYYLDRLIAAAQGELAKGKTVVFEPAFRDSDGAAVVDGELQLPLRKDLAVLHEGVMGLVTVETKSMLSFEPLVFTWGESLSVSMGPFQWQKVPLHMPVRNGTDWQPLKEWFWRWFQPDRDGDNERLVDAVHFLSDPEVLKKSVCFEVDLGSAPVEAFEELLDGISALQIKRCKIGQV